MDKRVVANEILLEDAAALMEEGREVTIKPLGYSMLPFIRGGKDSVRLKKMPAVAVGDMLLVRLPGPTYVLHRLIGKERRVAGRPMSLAPSLPSNGAPAWSNPATGSGGAASNHSEESF